MLEIDEKLKMIEVIEEMPSWPYRSMENMEAYAKHFKMRFYEAKKHYSILCRELSARYPEISVELLDDMPMGDDGKFHRNDKAIVDELCAISKVYSDWNWAACQSQLKINGNQFVEESHEI